MLISAGYTNLLTVKQIEEYLKVEEAALVGFFEKEKTNLEDIFLTYVYSVRYIGNLRIGYSSAEEVLAHYKQT